MLLEAAYAAGDVVRYEDAVLLFFSRVASLHVSEKTGKIFGGREKTGFSGAQKSFVWTPFESARLSELAKPVVVYAMVFP